MNTPPNAKARILDIAEKNGLSDTLELHGVDKVWELTKQEAENELFVPASQICLEVLTNL